MSSSSTCCVIVTYNIGKQFYDCFNSIKSQVNNVVIIDNGSDLETINVLEEIEHANNVKVVYNYENMGIATALNQGVYYALENGYEWVVTMDNDSIASENMVKSMLDTFNLLDQKDKDRIVSIFPKYIEQAFEKDKRRASKANIEKIKYVNMEITSGNMIRTKIFSDIGFFKEDLFIDYVDHEFCLRLRKNGFKLIQLEESFLFHRLGNSSRFDMLGFSVTYTNHSPSRVYYITRNSMYVWKIYISTFPKVIIKDIIFYIRKLIKIIFFEERRKEKIKMILKGICDYKSKKFGKLKL